MANNFTDIHMQQMNQAPPPGAGKKIENIFLRINKNKQKTKFKLRHGCLDRVLYQVYHRD